MLEIYDRVIPSKSVPTLIGLLTMALFLYLFQSALEIIRSRILSRVGVALDEALADRVFDAVVRLPLRGGGADGLNPVRDLDALRGFLGSGGPSALFDLPWLPVYVGICFLFHPLIGTAAVAAALVLVAFTLATDRTTRVAAKAAASHAQRRTAVAEAGRRNAEVLAAMGMQGALAAGWMRANRDHLREQVRIADVTGAFGSASKTFRAALQSGVLALGAWLVINNQASSGIIIASSILVSRALTPAEMAIANWKGFVQARQSWARLSDLFARLPETGVPHALPAPRADLSVEGVAVPAPGSVQLLVHDVSFRLKAGQGLGVIGPSASGKSSLARALVGVWPCGRGTVRLDGASLDQWSHASLGGHVGFLPQEAELFAGTVSQNIGRFADPVPAEAVIAAAQAAGVHELILRLPQGYDTRIGEGGAGLSAGQRQRIGLARALYGDPFLVVLDEPNANLDSAGENALTQAILGVRQRGGICVVVAHRPSALAAVDMVLVMAEGRGQAFGPKDEVLTRVLKPVGAPEGPEPAASRLAPSQPVHPVRGNA